MYLNCLLLIQIWYTNSNSSLILNCKWVTQIWTGSNFKIWSPVFYLRLNLKNLSLGLNLSRGSNMVGSTLNVFNFLRFKSALYRNRFLEDLSRGSNSLNSDTDAWNLIPKEQAWICLGNPVYPETGWYI